MRASLISDVIHIRHLVYSSSYREYFLKRCQVLSEPQYNEKVSSPIDSKSYKLPLDSLV